MMEAIDFLNDIEEVGAWPLYTSASNPSLCRDPACTNYHDHAAHSHPPSAVNSLNSGHGHGKLGSAADSPTSAGKFDSPVHLGKFDSPVHLGKFDSPLSNKSLPTFSPKLIFVDSPTNLISSSGYSTYVNPFDSNY